MRFKQVTRKRPSRLKLNERNFVRANNETHERVLGRLLGDLKTFDFYHRTDLIYDMASHPRLPRDFQPLYESGRTFHGTINLANHLRPDRYIYWLLGLFAANYKSLREFCYLKERVSNQILEGDAIGALKLLADLSKISECWWSIETAIHINREILGNDTKGYIKQLKDAYPNLNIAGITSDLLILSESASADFYVDTVLDRLREFHSSEIPSAIQHAGAESCLLLPAVFDKDRTVTLHSLYDYRSWSLFDQYLLFKDILCENIDDAALRESPAFNLIESLAHKVEDFELTNMLADHRCDDPFVTEIVKSYTYGDYSNVVAAIDAAVRSKSSKAFGLLEIYARARIYANSLGQSHTFFDKIADEFGKVLMLDARSAERTAYLIKIGIKFRRESWAKSLIFHVFSLGKADGTAELVERARLQTRSLGSLNTPKALHREFDLTDHVTVDTAAIPQHRILRHSSEPLAHAVDSAVFPIYSDYLDTQSRYLLESGNITAATRFCIDEYLKNNVAFDYLPIRFLCQTVTASETRGDSDDLLALILLDIYSRERDSAFELIKTERFESFLEERGSHQPSMIFASQPLTTYEAYFLRHLCVPAQLDNLVEYDSYDDIIHERVAILDLLTKERASDVDEIRSEKDRVLETLFSEKLRAKIESGKLFVDVQALEAHRRHIYENLFAQAKTLAGGVGLEPIDPDSPNLDSPDLVQIVDESLVAVTSSERSSLMLRIFSQAVGDFALNENYGLDKYLSAEVRHIVFTTQLRACFEKRQLLTSQKNGQYCENEYWIKKYNYVAPELLVQVDRCFQEFSQNIDHILQTVNDRFRVTTKDLSSNSVFDFRPYHDRLVRVSKMVEASESFDSFFQLLIAFMWELAGEGARSAQLVINETLLGDILRTVDRLDAQIQELKGNVAMHDLMQELRYLRTDIKNEVELVLNWFRFVGSSDSNTYEKLSVVMDAAVSSFLSIFRHRGKELRYTQERSDLLLNYNEARSLFIALFTALENALRYSTDDSSVCMSHRKHVGYDELTITNKMRERPIDAARFVKQLKEKWSEKYSRLSTIEGGTGLYKMFNLLSNASAGFTLDIAVEGDLFNSMIGIVHENFAHRG